MATALDEVTAAVRGEGSGETRTPAAASYDTDPQHKARVDRAMARNAKKPAKSKTDEPAPAESGKFRVQLKDNPPLVVEAADRLAAVEEYDRTFGILGTIHKHSVEAV